MTAMSPYQLAALALDSYHRGYNAGMRDAPGSSPGLSDSYGTPVAGGILIATAADLPGEDIQQADFYATAYLINGEIIISYRGSDNLQFKTEDGTTLWLGPDGYRVTAMAYGGTQVGPVHMGGAPDQALLALKFFNRVQQDNPGIPITTTGHSLGGALAGYVAYFKNTPAVLFDNTGYGSAIGDTNDKIDPSSSRYDINFFNAVFPSGVATPVAQGGVHTKIALENDIAARARFHDATVDTVDMGEELDEISAHIQSLLVLALYAREHLGEAGAWTNAANAVFTQLSNDATAAAVGIVAANGNAASGVMKDMIASTLLPGGNGAFGSAAAVSLVNDMSDLGAAWGNADLSWWVDLAVRYASFQAKYGVMAGGNPGTIYFDQATETLVADMREEKWTFDGNQVLSAGPALDFSTLLDDDELDAAERLSLSSASMHADFFLQAVGTDGVDANIGYQSADHTVRFIATGGDDVISGTGGNEQFVLGAGNDEVAAGGGVNWVDGGDGDDTLVDTFAWSDFEISKEGNRYFFALKASGSDPRIHVVQNVEFFVLNDVEYDLNNILNVAPDHVEFASGGVFQGDTVVLRAGAEVARLAGIDANTDDILTYDLHADSQRYFYLDGNIVRALGDISLSLATFAAMFPNGAPGLQSGLTTDISWQSDAAFMDSFYVVKAIVLDSYDLETETTLLLGLEQSPVAPGNHLIGTPNDDVLTGGAGRTVIAGLGGADQIRAQDWLVVDYSASDAGVTLNRASWQTYTINGSGGHAQGDAIGVWNVRYDVIGSSHGDIIQRADHVYAGDGDDVIHHSNHVVAGGGYDKVYAGSNTNYVDFGTGGGELHLVTNAQQYFVDMGQGIYHRVTGAGAIVHSLTVVGSYNKIYGSNYNDTIIGSAGDDHIYGGIGPHDILRGGAGDDYIEGYGQLWGDGGNDTIKVLSGSGMGGDGSDIMSLHTSNGSLDGGAGNDTLTSYGRDSVLTGGAGADNIVSLGYSAIISYEGSQSGVGVTYSGYTGTGTGWAGDASGDTLQGDNLRFLGSGHADQFDLMMWQHGTLRAGSGNDVINVHSIAGYVEVYGDGLDDPVFADGADDDTITVTGANATVYGGRGNDIITGVGALHGGTGADVLTSAAGNHAVYLGVDNDIDTVMFLGQTGTDTVFDFTAIDRISIFAGHEYDSFADVMDNASQHGTRVVIDFGYGAVIRIAGYNLAQLSEDNFIFA